MNVFHDRIVHSIRNLARRLTRSLLELVTALNWCFDDVFESEVPHSHLRLVDRILKGTMRRCLKEYHIVALFISLWHTVKG